MIIANPLATDKQLEMINKSLKKISSVCSGIKACTKEIMKNSKGMVVLTADTTPMDLITHIPAMCEEKGIKYIFVEKKDQLVNSYTCVFLDKENAIELYESIKK
jgi:H/ACA ribonucleoprotein complex subunit 2